MRWVGKLTFLVVVSLVVLGLSASPQDPYTQALLAAVPQIPE